MPYRLEKFYKSGFDPVEFWESKYSAANMASKANDEFRKQKFWPLLEKNMHPSGRYLDAGCGVGGWIIFLKDAGYYNVAGIDVAARAVRAITEYDRDAEVKVASITEIPYGDSTFDGVLAIGTLEYLESTVEQGIAEVHRVLKPGAFFLMEVPVANVLRHVLYLPLKRIERMLKKMQGKQPVFVSHFFTRSEVVALLEKAGFVVETVQAHELPEADRHYGLYVDWKFLRGKGPYQLNMLGRLIKAITNAISPWIASTGMVVLVRKKS